MFLSLPVVFLLLPILLQVALMAAEKKIRADLEDCRQQVKKMSETNKEAVKKLADEDATRRIKQLDDQV